MSIQIQEQTKDGDQIGQMNHQIAVPEWRSYGYHLWKRVFDIIFGFSFLLCCLPLFILVSALIIILSGRPVFFIQTRTGTTNKRFLILKFRTMTVSKHNEKRHTYNWKEGVPDSFQFKTEYDSAVTPIGKVLRKYSLDELPQLVNVLMGHMSLVGPRPEIPAITEMYNLRQSKRLLVKPGITGYAQVKGRADLNHGKKIDCDLYYIQHCSFLLDLKIIFLTLYSVLRSKGAY